MRPTGGTGWRDDRRSKGRHRWPCRHGSQRLTKIVGPARAKQLLFTAEPIDAELALHWGLVNNVVDGDALEGAAQLADTIASRAPQSNRMAKRLIDIAVDAPLNAGLVAASTAQQKVFDGVELVSGAQAFLAKRLPVFP